MSTRGNNSSRPQSDDVTGMPGFTTKEVSVIVRGSSGLAEDAIKTQLTKKVPSLSNPQAKQHHNCTITISSTRLLAQDSLMVTVASQREADILRELSGIRIGSTNKLKITLSTRAVSPTPPPPSILGAGGENTSVQALSQVIQERYQPQGRYLNLDGIDNSVFDKYSRAGAVLCQLIGQICPDVETISFAQNNIKVLSCHSKQSKGTRIFVINYCQSLKSIETLAKTVPNLVNLSFKNNSIEKFSEISSFPGAKMTRLRELFFMGNPICPDGAKKGSMLHYQQYV
jgi:hypothetical protein